MSLELVVFAIASGLAIVSALAVVVVKKPVRSVISLVVTFFALAILSVLLAAPFIAAIQVIVYAGAILVLFLFVVMLLNLTNEAASKDRRPIQRLLGLVSVVALGGLLLGVTLRAGAPPVPAAGGLIPAKDEIPILGRLLFSDYLLAFEALSVLLLLAAVGALVLSKRRFD
ncbi:MAG: NADH-quinone oxidoreductase subunit J [Thermoanaerobaculia bacterium]|jgi:NADH-quinone oxidoreductase subunit J|nr:NADH-quinone oxidoreductase subunit J [Thermoanaerobaculia bacterium]